MGARLAAMAACVTLLIGAVALMGSGCGGTGAPTEAGIPDAVEEMIDLCATFTAVGAPCPRAGPTRCFPMCRSGGCFCRAGAGGPTWACTTDTSCLPPCPPLDDACASSAPGEAGPADLGGDAGSE